METKPNLKLTVPFFMVRDMAKSLHFYVDGLGFKITNMWEPRGKIEWCWLQRDSVSFMLQKPRDSGSYFEKLGGKPGVGVSICFQCEDALALYHEFKNKDLQPKEPFVGNGLWVVRIPDPDGYMLDFESVTDVPEETKFSEWNR